MTTLHEGTVSDFTVVEVEDGEKLTPVIALLGSRLLTWAPRERRSWQSQNVEGDVFSTYELNDVTVHMYVHSDPETTREILEPDMPWAEEHFQERVCGEPLNPPPSHVNWPYHAGQQEKHLTAEGKKFDHTYPERFWPKLAGGDMPGLAEDEPNYGIRFYYGDLNDVINLLTKDVTTRQAYLPIFFPEDTGATQGQRVPCTLGYHFIADPFAETLDIKYYIRSCDIYRHFRNDVYFTHRLLQHVCEKVSTAIGDTVEPGNMTMHISNLHLFKGNAWRYQ
jgi:hypothetical protein